MSAPKYYVETSELTSYGDSTADMFHHDTPFDTVDEAKAWVEDNPGEDHVTIYECRDNIITPILETWTDEDVEWEVWKP